MLERRPGVQEVQANAVSQTATAFYDPALTSVAELAGWVRDCWYHCAGRSVPEHLCDPLVDAEHTAHEARTSAGDFGHETHAAHPPSAQEAMGHDGHHDGMSMQDMARDMRNRFLIALVLTGAITLWCPMGRDMFGFTAPAPFGLSGQVFALLLSLPVVFYSAWIFFDGAYRALRARTLDMMVLVAVAVSAGWLYSVGATVTGGDDVFYEAAAMLTALVLLGQWFEMRARGGTIDAIALPIAAGVFEPSLSLVLRPEIAALTMSGSSFLVAMNALRLKRLQLPQHPAPSPQHQPAPVS